MHPLIFKYIAVFNWTIFRTFIEKLGHTEPDQKIWKFNPKHLMSNRLEHRVGWGRIRLKYSYRTRCRTTVWEGYFLSTLFEKDIFWEGCLKRIFLRRLFEKDIFLEGYLRRIFFWLCISIYLQTCAILGFWCKTSQVSPLYIYIYLLIL